MTHNTRSDGCVGALTVPLGAVRCCTSLLYCWLLMVRRWLPHVLLPPLRERLYLHVYPASASARCPAHRPRRGGGCAAGSATAAHCGESRRRGGLPGQHASGQLRRRGAGVSDLHEEGLRLPVARALPDRAGVPAANTLHRLPPAARSDCLRRVTGSRFPERPPEAWSSAGRRPPPAGPPEAWPRRRQPVRIVSEVDVKQRGGLGCAYLSTGLVYRSCLFSCRSRITPTAVRQAMLRAVSQGPTREGSRRASTRLVSPTTTAAASATSVPLLPM